MDRLNHIKIVTPDPDAVDRFLREVLDVPEGWPVSPAADVSGSTQPSSSDAGDALTMEDIDAFRGASGGDGYIVGSPDSRQFQVFAGERPHIWAVAIGTRNIERAHERCMEREIPCTGLELANWNDGEVRFFFARVGGILFEVLRVEE